MRRVIELFDVQAGMAVQVAWPDDGSEAQVSFLTKDHKIAKRVPASVLRLADAVARDPEVQPPRTVRMELVDLH